jgi:hypothetical protein
MIKAGGKFKVSIEIYSDIPQLEIPMYVELVLLKPSSLIGGVFKERIVLASGGITFNESNSQADTSKLGRRIKSFEFEGFIPRNIGDGEYLTQAWIYVPFVSYIPSPNFHPCEYYLKIYGGNDTSLISDKQINDIFLKILWFVPLLFITGLIFVSSKKIIYQKIDERKHK